MFLYVQQIASLGRQCCHIPLHGKRQMHVSLPQGQAGAAAGAEAEGPCGQWACQIWMKSHHH